MEIKVLGGGCANCANLENNVKHALEKVGKKAEIIKVKDMEKIIEYGVMSLPALVIDEEVVKFGEVTPVEEIIELLK